jgi:hypothetical protein
MVSHGSQWEPFLNNMDWINAISLKWCVIRMKKVRICALCIVVCIVHCCVHCALLCALCIVVCIVHCCVHCALLFAIWTQYSVTCYKRMCPPLSRDRYYKNSVKEPWLIMRAIPQHYELNKWLNFSQRHKRSKGTTRRALAQIVCLKNEKS